MLPRWRLASWLVAVAFFALPAVVQADGTVYVGHQCCFDRVANSVSQHAIGTGGLLSPLTPASVEVRERPGEIAIAPNGKSAYVLCGGNVCQYDIDPGTGALSPKTPASVAADPREARSIAVAPDGESAYVLGGSLSRSTTSTPRAGCCRRRIRRASQQRHRRQDCREPRRQERIRVALRRLHLAVQHRPRERGAVAEGSADRCSRLRCQEDCREPRRQERIRHRRRTIRRGRSIRHRPRDRQAVAEDRRRPSRSDNPGRLGASVRRIWP